MKGEHLEHVAKVFQCLRENALVVNGEKCDYGVGRVAYLGYMISEAGVSVDDEKIVAMTKWPTPKNLKELRGFLGLNDYYRRFVKGYVNLAKAITNKLKKDLFAWNEEADQAFGQLKIAMTKLPVLARIPKAIYSGN